MFRRAHLCLALLLIALVPRPAAAKWVTLRSTNFVFVGDAPERQIRRVAQKLEQFREVVGRLMPGVAGPSPVPFVVVVFADQRSFRPYVPHFQGRAVEVGGYFAGGDETAYIALSADPDFEELAFQTIFHEYAHYLTAASGITLPPWASEGMAQVWETMEDRDGGRAAVVGIASSAQVALLRSSTPIPLRDLRAVGHNSPLYNEGTRRSVFYAQSWALAHYLMLGNPARAKQYGTYLSALRRGAGAEEAFSEAFGADDRVLEQELFEYVRKFTFPAMKYEFADKIDAAVTGRGEPLADAEAHGYLGDLLARVGRADDARTLLTATLKSNPSAVRPAVSLGLLDLREGKLTDALAHLEAAVTRAPADGPALAALGRTLIERADEQGNVGAPLRLRAREVLTRAVAAEGAAAHVLAMLALLELNEGHPDRSVSLLEQALRQSPTRDDYRLMIAEALIRQQQFDRVPGYLGPVAAAGRTPELRDQARRMLGSYADRKSATESRATQAQPDASSPDQPPRSVSSPAQAAGASTPRFILDLRPVGAGETRTLGLFRGIECPDRVVVILVDTDNGRLRLSAERFDRVDFISYRSDAARSVTCGLLPTPVRALVTHRSDRKAIADSDGLAVAVELVPDGYTPR